MKLYAHGTTFESADFDEDSIQLSLKDRDGNQIELFFDNLDDVRELATEATRQADVIEERAKENEPGQCWSCEGSGMGPIFDSRCHVCGGEGELG
ncbi:hypothetical protein [Marinobacter sp.]|uniref:hypothetical protein n=1 Tax=Marinobacter sp. TaxID=50741 RepID=UPI003A956223